MHSAIDEDLIRSAAPHSDWYLRLEKHLKQLGSLAKDDKTIAGDLRSLFEDLIASDELKTGREMPILDEERLPIDTAIIHHTSQKPGLSLKRLNVIQLLNIYVPYYQNPSLASEKNLKGQAITSNHFHEGKTIFWGYHWIIRMDGSCERILPDTALGWHAGNWEINRRSVGICLDNDYEDQDPTPEVLKSLRELLQEHYPQITNDKVLGHREVRQGTICPGANFNHWKKLV